MKITTRGNLQFVAELVLKFIAKFAYMRKIKMVLAIGMWRGNNVGNSVGNRRFRHGHGFFHVGCAVIETRKNMAM